VGADTSRARFRGCLLGLAVGDALGAPFEGRTRVDPPAFDRWADAPQPLRWTDDTAMSVGVAQSLVECRGFDGAHMAETLAGVYEAEPWRGYGSGPPEVFAALRRGAAWTEAAAGLFGGDGSFGNGGAMRAAPVGLVAADRAEAVRLAHDQAAITHAHALGRQGAAVQAVAVAWAAQAPGDADPRGVLGEVRSAATAPPLVAALDRLAALGPDASPTSVAAALGNGVAAVEAVPAALAAFLRHPRSLPEVVRTAVLIGGDTDTVAAMAGAVAGALLGEHAVPDRWRTRLEGADHLVALADRLLDLREGRGSGVADV